MVLFKSYLSCYLNPESLFWFDFAWSFLCRLTQLSGREKTPNVALSPNLFSYCLWCSMWLSLAQLTADICYVLLRLWGQGQRQLDRSCGQREVDTCPGRREEVVSDSQEALQTPLCRLSTLLGETLPKWTHSTKQRENSRYPSKGGLEGLTKEKWLFLQNRDLNLASAAPPFLAASPPRGPAQLHCPPLSHPGASFSCRKSGHSRPGLL